jgi:hypothetical protein
MLRILLVRLRRWCRCCGWIATTRLDRFKGYAGHCGDFPTRLYRCISILDEEASLIVLLTSPTPSRSVSNAQPPQSVYTVTVLVLCMKVQFVLKDGSLRTIIEHVGAAVDIELDIGEHVLAGG